ncbi:hypothetical protein KXR53_32240 [Inquilinus limosus]|uniref:DUF1016 N-terminal domain-containing protein n=1 Tax=Inquilinus limosus TaxID=171674 RepID=UPI003F16F7FF
MLRDLKERIRSARLRTAAAVNQSLVMLYWSIGREILARQTTEGWGTRVIERLSADLRRDFPEMKGLSARNLGYMKAFAEAYTDPEILQQLVAELPWGHNVRLLETVQNPDERIWYARQAVEHGWSRAVLEHQNRKRAGAPSRQGHQQLRSIAPEAAIRSGPADDIRGCCGSSTRSWDGCCRAVSESRMRFPQMMQRGRTWRCCASASARSAGCARRCIRIISSGSTEGRPISL